VKILWLQQQVEKKMVSVAAVATAANIADLGTKRLPCHTMRKLMYMVGVNNGSEEVGAMEYEEDQQKKLIKGVMQMRAEGRGVGNLQMALLTAMIPNALGSRVAMDGTSVFWKFSIEVPIWFLVLVGIIDYHWDLRGEGDQRTKGSSIQLEESMQRNVFG